MRRRGNASRIAVSCGKKVNNGVFKRKRPVVVWEIKRRLAITGAGEGTMSFVVNGESVERME